MLLTFFILFLRLHLFPSKFILYAVWILVFWTLVLLYNVYCILVYCTHYTVQYVLHTVFYLSFIFNFDLIICFISFYIWIII